MQLAQESRDATSHAVGERRHDLQVPEPWASAIPTVDDSEAHAIGFFHEIALD